MLVRPQEPGGVRRLDSYAGGSSGEAQLAMEKFATDSSAFAESEALARI